MTTIEQRSGVTPGARRAQEQRDRLSASIDPVQRGGAGSGLRLLTMMVLAIPATGLLAVLGVLAAWPLVGVLGGVMTEVL